MMRGAGTVKLESKELCCHFVEGSVNNVDRFDRLFGLFCSAPRSLGGLLLIYEIDEVPD